MGFVIQFGFLRIWWAVGWSTYHVKSSGPRWKSITDCQDCLACMVAMPLDKSFPVILHILLPCVIFCTSLILFARSFSLVRWTSYPNPFSLSLPQSVSSALEVPRFCLLTGLSVLVTVNSLWLVSCPFTIHGNCMLLLVTQSILPNKLSNFAKYSYFLKDPIVGDSISKSKLVFQPCLQIWAIRGTIQFMIEREMKKSHGQRTVGKVYLPK